MAIFENTASEPGAVKHWAWVGGKWVPVEVLEVLDHDGPRVPGWLSEYMGRQKARG